MRFAPAQKSDPPTAMPEFYIEKNVPMPARRQPGKCKYPFAEMKVGDSFFAKGIKPSTLASSSNTWGKNHGVKFVVRTVEGGSQIWRVE